MAAPDISSIPQSLKQVQHYLKIAQEHDGRDLVVSYWCRLYALQVGLKMSTHQPDETKLLMGIMDWLETIKKENSENESITNEVAAQAHLENYALKVFMYADKQDRESNFGKNVVKAFYTSGIIYDVMQTFGELTDEAIQNRKYAKWKAAYIHNCLKNGETPVPGPMTNEEGSEGGSGVSPTYQAEEPASADDGGDEASDDNSSGPAPIKPITPEDIQPSNIKAKEVLENPDILPSPPVDEEKSPGGFVPFAGSLQVAEHAYVPPPIDVKLTPDQITKAQKYCRYAGSALNYDDIKTALDNLQKALRLLTTGHDE